MPLWDYRGSPSFGVFTDGAYAKVLQPVAGQTGCPSLGMNVTNRCVPLQWPSAQNPYNKAIGSYLGTLSWMGSILESQRDASGLDYMRNRVYDSKTGRFTQEDPIGLAGGLNLYGYAGGDPVNFSDPFGLAHMDTYVNCRPVGGTGKEGVVAHCAVRVVDEKRGIDQTIELAPDGKGKKEIYWALGSSDRTKAYASDSWMKVPVPSGMTSTEFDNGVLSAAFRETKSQRGSPYWPTGNTNSNRFVRRVIINAGGDVPSGADGGFLFGAPGLCGGVFVTGDRCR